MTKIPITCLLFVIFGISLLNALPEGYKSTGQKLVKIKEHEKTKKILILQKSEISSPAKHSQEEEDDDAAEENHPSPPEEEEENEDEESSHGGSGGLSHVGKAVDGGTCVQNPQPLGSYRRFAKVTLAHRMFILASSKYYGNQASLVLTGKPIEENKLSNACLRVIWEGNRRRLQGWDHKGILACTADEITDQTCFKPERPDGPNLRITYVWTDGRSHLLAIMCGNGKASWAILSNKREIGASSKETILNIVEKYGFKKEDHYEYSFTDNECVVAIRSDIQEGTCVDTDDDLQTIPQSKLEHARRILEKGVYTPLSNLANIYGTGMFIRGTPIQPQEDLDVGCVKDKWNEHGEILRIGYDGKKAYLECNNDDFTQITCVPNEEKTKDHENNYVYNKHIHPIWTDGKKYVLTYNCLSTHLKTWALYSTSNEPLDPKTKKYVLSKVADYGFDPIKAHESSYENCKN